MNRRDPNLWRYSLDPRDPDYEDPSELTDEADEEPSDQDECHQFYDGTGVNGF
jgi:hypothetical protein